MWLAQSMKQAVPTADADQGISTIVGDQMGVVTRGEVRQLPIYGPGVMCGCRRAGLPCWSLRAAPAERSSASAAVSRRRSQRGCSPGRSIFTAQRAAMCICRRTGLLN